MLQFVRGGNLNRTDLPVKVASDAGLGGTYERRRIFD